MNRITPAPPLAPALVAVVLWASLGMAVAWGADPREEFFERRVRPILAANCYSCHGEKEQESGLRLDSRESVLRGGDAEGPAAEPGNVDASVLVQAIRWTGDLQMPPKNPLKPEEIQILERWVADGVFWPERSAGAEGEGWRSHWAFQPIRPPAVPPEDPEGWGTTAIDRFISQERRRANLSAAGEADRRTLIRRANLDLLGVPPSADEVDAFVHDDSPDAWERLLQRLLAAPAYGERWGRHWLDIARYADNKGYVFFEEKKFPWAYTYRDYVVRSLNGDLPYDQFVRQQLVADQLDLEDPRARTALGFLTLGSHFMNNTHDILDDRIDVITRGLLGMTVTCSRCHDHKYDPIPAADYYALYGILRSSYEPLVLPALEAPADTEEHRTFAAEMKTREDKLMGFLAQKHSELVTDGRVRATEYLQTAHRLREHPPTADFMLIADKGDLNPTMIVRWQTFLNRHDASDPIWGPWHELLHVPADQFAAQAAKMTESLVAPTGESRKVNRRLADALRQEPLVSAESLIERYGRLLRTVDEEWQAAVADAAAKNAPAPTRLTDDDSEALRQVLYGPLSPPQVPISMDWGFLSLFPDRATQQEYEKLLKETEQWMMTGPGAPPRAMVLIDAPQPYDPRVFLRGNPQQLGAEVPRRFLTALGGEQQPYTRGSGRAELAESIVHPSNPLTPRVIVNRVWLHHFGEGLVRTPSDFGLRSDPPSHPELLDWLAQQLPAHGWSLKWLHLEIMRSAVYRQASVPADPRVAEADPQNRLLTYFPRQRLDFEQQRDALLAVAEQLQPRIGGPAVDLLGDAIVPRRTLYGAIDRMDVPTLLTTFDFPNPLTTSPQRSQTMVPPQALYLMNSPFVREIANQLVARPDVQAAGTTLDRLTRIYEICFSRPPLGDERIAAEMFLGDQPDAKRWQELAQGLLMTNEFVFVD